MHIFNCEYIHERPLQCGEAVAQTANRIFRKSTHICTYICTQLHTYKHIYICMWVEEAVETMKPKKVLDKRTVQIRQK